MQMHFIHNLRWCNGWVGVSPLSHPDPCASIVKLVLEDHECVLVALTSIRLKYITGGKSYISNLPRTCRCVFLCVCAAAHPACGGS